VAVDDRDAALTVGASSATDEARLETWERRSRPAIIAAAVIPLIGVTTGQSEFGVVGNTIEVACWVVFLVDLIVHMRLRPGYLHTGIGRFDLSVVVLTSPWYLLPGVDGGQFVTILRLARLARVAMLGFKTPMVKRTIERLGRPFLYVGIMLMVCAAIVERAEDHENGFTTYGDSLWWGVVTITTVGYGDIVPETRVGRLTASFLMLTGVALLGTVAASLASLFRLEDKADEESGAEAFDAVTATKAAQSVASSPAVTVPADDGVEATVAAELRALRAEVAALREEIGRLAPDGSADT
jgi:voltage-gated potassium channel Kch